MAQLVRLFRGLATRALSNKGLCNRSFCKALVIIALVCVLSLSVTAWAQSRGTRERGEPIPPRPHQSYKPLPWFLAFILLGLAWYPAFKNSKRELSE